MMNTFDKIHDITVRLDNLENLGDWLARALVHVDPAASQTGSLITVLSSDIRDKLIHLVTELESELSEVREAFH